MESCYDKIQYSKELGETKKWDFSRYIPQLVVVAIGQNDSHPQDYMAEDYLSREAVNWREHYRQFIEKLLAIYPGSHIVLTTTILNHDSSWDKAIDQVCAEMKNDRVSHFLYSNNGTGTPGHIRIPEAEVMAEELADYIETLRIAW